MADILTILTIIGVLLLIGILISIVSAKIKVPSILLLLLVGVFAGNILYKGQPIIDLPPLFLTGIGILALIMIVFDSCAKLNIKEMEKYSVPALKLAMTFLVLNAIFLSIATFFIYGTTVQFAILFAVLMSGTAPDVVLSMLSTTKNKVVEILEMEAIINTPLTVLLPFMILEFGEIVNVKFLFTKTVEQITPFLTQIIVGIGAGMLIGIVLFEVMKNKYSEKLSPLAIITAALVTYVLAENLSGNGVVAVTTLGFFFGTLQVKRKISLLGFESVFSNSLRILVFILLGTIIQIPLTFDFFIKSLSIFLIFLVIRFITIMITFGEYELKERIFMTLSVSKGIAVAVVTFFLITYNLEGMREILNLALMFILYSILVSSITAWFSKHLIKENIKPEKI